MLYRESYLQSLQNTNQGVVRSIVWRYAKDGGQYD